MLSKRTLASLASAAVGLGALPVPAGATPVASAYEMYQDAMARDYSVTVSYDVVDQFVRPADNAAGFEFYDFITHKTEHGEYGCTSTEILWLSSEAQASPEGKAADADREQARSECQRLKSDVLAAVTAERWSPELEADVSQISDIDVDQIMSTKRSEYLAENKVDLEPGQLLPQSVRATIAELSPYYAPAAVYLDATDKTYVDGFRNQPWSRELDDALAKLGASGGASTLLSEKRKSVVDRYTYMAWSAALEDPATSDLKFLSDKGHTAATQKLTTIRAAYVAPWEKYTQWSEELDVALAPIAPFYSFANTKLEGLRKPIIEQANALTRWNSLSDLQLTVMAKDGSTQAANVLATMRMKLVAQFEGQGWSESMESTLDPVAKIDPTNTTKNVADLLDTKRLEFVRAHENDDWTPALATQFQLMADNGFTEAATVIDRITSQKVNDDKPVVGGDDQTTGTGNDNDGQGESDETTQPSIHIDHDQDLEYGQWAEMFSPLANTDLWTLVDDVYKNATDPDERDAYTNAVLNRAGDFYDPEAIAALDKLAEYGNAQAESTALVWRLKLAAVILVPIFALIGAVYQWAHTQGLV